jgi:transcriptional regulator of acetoin/glycerol metabolism
MSLADTEKLLISATLRQTGGNIGDSAAILGIDRSTLYGKIKRYAIPR